MDKLDRISSKIVSLEKYMDSRDRESPAKIVFTNGCFDILHKGHIELLAKASDLGDILIVGLNSDESVKRLKGKDRPVQDQSSRAMVLASLEFVDYVIVFREDTPAILIDTIIPDFLVKGGDYNPAEIVGYETVVQNGGKVLCIDLVKGYSSSSIIEKIK